MDTTTPENTRTSPTASHYTVTPDTVREAAPHLLAALRRCLETVTDGPTRVTARAAIAKADGLCGAVGRYDVPYICDRPAGHPGHHICGGDFRWMEDDR